MGCGLITATMREDPYDAASVAWHLRPFVEVERQAVGTLDAVEVGPDRRQQCRHWLDQPVPSFSGPTVKRP